MGSDSERKSANIGFNFDHGVFMSYSATSNVTTTVDFLEQFFIGFHAAKPQESAALKAELIKVLSAYSNSPQTQHVYAEIKQLISRL